MSTAGQEMMKSVTSNLSQKRSKSRYFDRKLDTNQNFDNLKDAPKLTKEELAAFTHNFKKEQRKWRLKVYGISAIVCIVLGIVVMLITS